MGQAVRAVSRDDEQGGSGELYSDRYAEQTGNRCIFAGNFLSEFLLRFLPERLLNFWGIYTCKSYPVLAIINI